MSNHVCLRRLRPYLSSAFTRLQHPAHTRPITHTAPLRVEQKERDVTHDYEKRLAQLDAHNPLSQSYPALSQEAARTRTQKLHLERDYGHLAPDATDVDSTLTLAGRIRSLRSAGSKLIFVDIQLWDGSVQAVCKLATLSESCNATQESLKAFARIARKGDVYSIRGHPHCTARGELSILATNLPVLLAPSLHQIPDTLQDPEVRARSRHVDMLVNPEAIQTLRVRHEVEAGLQHFFNHQGFIKVNTPILTAGAGGAAARPFETEATELANEKLSLRIAPELWLKRLVVGGMEKVYEIGPAFRNEGVDLTHNPEFNICEFYQAYATLHDLLRTTMTLICDLKDRISELKKEGLLADLAEPYSVIDEGFQEIEFIPGLEDKLGRKLPDLQSQDASERLLEIFSENNIPIPVKRTLPRLLDTLAAHYLEPHSHSQPTFITHHPACMSPLSRHFVCPETGQVVAARAELFIAGREYANMYEEENSPFEQRRKFEEQIKERELDDEAMDIDESYLRALEWGLPPTGGWGCGVDRLVMLFSGRERISDTLAFGSVRNVVTLGKEGKRK